MFETGGSVGFLALEERQDPGFEEHCELVPDNQNQASGGGRLLGFGLRPKVFPGMNCSTCQYLGLVMIMS